MNVRFRLLADILDADWRVCFPPRSGHCSGEDRCLFLTQGGRSAGIATCWKRPEATTRRLTAAIAHFGPPYELVATKAPSRFRVRTGRSLAQLGASTCPCWCESTLRTGALAMGESDPVAYRDMAARCSPANRREPNSAGSRRSRWVPSVLVLVLCSGIGLGSQSARAGAFYDGLVAYNTRDYAGAARTRRGRSSIETVRDETDWLLSPQSQRFAVPRLLAYVPGKFT